MGWYKEESMVWSVFVGFLYMGNDRLLLFVDQYIEAVEFILLFKCKIQFGVDIFQVFAEEFNLSRVTIKY